VFRNPSPGFTGWRASPVLPVGSTNTPGQVWRRGFSFPEKAVVKQCSFSLWLPLSISEFSANPEDCSVHDGNRGDQLSSHFCLKSGIHSTTAQCFLQSLLSSLAGSMTRAGLGRPVPGLCCEGHSPLVSQQPSPTQRAGAQHPGPGWPARRLIAWWDGS